MAPHAQHHSTIPISLTINQRFYLYDGRHHPVSALVHARPPPNNTSPNSTNHIPPGHPSPSWSSQSPWTIPGLLLRPGPLMELCARPTNELPPRSTREVRKTGTHRIQTCLVQRCGRDSEGLQHNEQVLQSKCNTHATSFSHNILNSWT